MVVPVQLAVRSSSHPLCDAPMLCGAVPSALLLPSVSIRCSIRRSTRSYAYFDVLSAPPPPPLTAMHPSLPHWGNVWPTPPPTLHCAALVLHLIMGTIHHDGPIDAHACSPHAQALTTYPPPNPPPRSHRQGRAVPLSPSATSDASVPASLLRSGHRVLLRSRIVPGGAALL